jgi:2-aminoadipate transaminase
MTELRTTQISISEEFIDFGVGQPQPSLLPLDMLQQAAEHRLSQSDPGILQYGAEQGDGYFRLALAEFLTNGYQIRVTAEQLFVTAGASQGLDLICTLFTQPGDVIFVEEPTYFLALRIFADHHLKVMSIPTDEQGLVVEALEERLKSHKPAFIYTIPTFQNPAGATLPWSRRSRLVELSRRFEFLIVADEVYHLLHYSIVPPAPMASFIEHETVISLGSFSKILAPGLRLGWIQAAPVLLQRLVSSGLLDSGGGLNPFTSGVIRSMLELGLQSDHLRQLKTIYQQRATALSQGLQRNLPSEISFAEPEGGFFIWLKMPIGIDTAELLTIARQHEVGFQPGVKFSSEQGLRNYMRLCFAFYDVPNLLEGVSRLQRVL